MFRFNPAAELDEHTRHSLSRNLDALNETMLELITHLQHVGELPALPREVEEHHALVAKSLFSFASQTSPFQAVDAIARYRASEEEQKVLVDFKHQLEASRAVREALLFLSALRQMQLYVDPKPLQA